MIKKITIVLAIAILHFGLTVLLFLMDFSNMMSAFDDGAHPTTQQNLIHLTTTVMTWPIMDPLIRWGGRSVTQLFPGMLGYIPMFLNSLVWGLAGLLVITILMKKRRTEPGH